MCKYIFSENISEIKPSKLDVEGGQFKQFLYIWLCIKPYLSAFTLFYALLSRKQNHFNVNTIIELTKNIISRVLVGFSLSTIKKAKFIITKIKNIRKLPLKNHNDMIFFNINLEEINSCMNMEKLRIYKTKESLFNFNPNKTPIKMVSKLFPKFKFLDVETLEEKKIVDNIIGVEKELKEETVKGYFSSDNHPKHFGTLYPLTSDQMVGATYTSKPTTFELKNEALSDKTYLTQKFIANMVDLKFDEKLEVPKNIYDLRNISEKIKIVEYFLLTSLGMPDDHYAMYNPITKKFNVLDTNTHLTTKKERQTALEKVIESFDLKKDEQPSKIVELDLWFKEEYRNLKDETLLKKEIVFRKVMTTLLESPEVRDILHEYIDKKN